MIPTHRNFPHWIKIPAPRGYHKSDLLWATVWFIALGAFTFFAVLAWVS